MILAQELGELVGPGGWAEWGPGRANETGGVSAVTAVTVTGYVVLIFITITGNLLVIAAFLRDPALQVRTGVGLEKELGEGGVGLVGDNELLDRVAGADGRGAVADGDAAASEPGAERGQVDAGAPHVRRLHLPRRPQLLLLHLPPRPHQPRPLPLRPLPDSLPLLPLPPPDPLRHRHDLALVHEHQPPQALVERPQ